MYLYRVCIYLCMYVSRTTCTHQSHTCVIGLGRNVQQDSTFSRQDAPTCRPNLGSLPPRPAAEGVSDLAL